jgi:hypothetical protein
MNAIAKAKAVESAPAVLPEEIRAKLTEAKARFGALTTRQMELAEKSVQSPAIEAEYFRVIDEMSKVSGDLERYQLAISAMDRRATEQLKAAEAAEIAALCGRTSDLLEHRIQAAARFSAAVTEAVKAMREIAALGKAAFDSWPGSHQPQSGVVFGGEELSTLIAGEMFRLGGVRIPSGGALASSEMPLPAPRPPTIFNVGEPSLTKPLSLALEEANTYAKTLLTMGG